MKKEKVRRLGASELKDAAGGCSVARATTAGYCSTDSAGKCNPDWDAEGPCLLRP